MNPKLIINIPFITVLSYQNEKKTMNNTINAMFYFEKKWQVISFRTYEWEHYDYKEQLHLEFILQTI